MNKVTLTREQWTSIKKNLISICKELHNQGHDELIDNDQPAEEVFQAILKHTRKVNKRARQFDPFATTKSGRGIFIYWTKKGWFHATIDQDGEPVYTKFRLNKTFKLLSDSKDAGFVHDDELQLGKSKKKPKAFDFLYAQEFLKEKDLKKLPNDNVKGLKKFKRAHHD